MRSSNITAVRSIWRGGCRAIARTALVVGFVLALAQGCSRTGLYVGGVDGGEEEEPLPCEEGEITSCGSDVGACAPGIRECVDGFFGECMGAIAPVAEECNAIDDDCDGTTDEGFHLGEACDGPDSDLCTDDVVICGGCSRGNDTLETCNGFDDDCDGIVDADCESGDCGPTLLVTGSVPSSPGCVDFPVQAGSTGTIEYPCGGGPVTATLGEVAFTGGVEGGQVSLGGTVIITADRSPDGCIWETKHQITGSVGSGTLTYSYSEMWITGTGCWFPCTETGTVEIKWVE